METTKAHNLGVSGPLMQMVYEAIRRGLAARQGHASFSPFAITGSDQGPGPMTVLATETPDEAIATARWLLAQGFWRYFVLAFDGYLTDAGAGIPRTEAIHVEAYEQGQDHGVRFAQRYAADDSQGLVRPIGNPIYGGALPLPTVEQYGPVVERYRRERENQGKMDNH